MTGYIYCIENKVNHKMYIGKTIRKISTRLSNHRNSAKRGSNCTVHKAIRKYGISNFDTFELEVLYNSDKYTLNQNLSYSEIFFIEKLDTFYHGYNMTKGGDGFLGVDMSGEKNPYYRKFGKDHPFFVCHHTEEAKRRISIGASKNHINVSGKNNPMYGKKGVLAPLYGKHHTEETKKKISKGKIGVKKSAESIRKSQENRIQLTGVNHYMWMKRGKECPNYGIKRSEETKKKMSIANSKPVRCIETGKEYYGMSEVRRQTGIKCVSQVINGVNKTAGGFHWELI